MATDKRNDHPKADKLNSKPQSGGFKEKEEDLYVLVDRKNPIVKDGPLVSSYDYPPTKDGELEDKGNGREKDGWETIPLYGNKNSDKKSKG